jgi:predicted secreted protein
MSHPTDDCRSGRIIFVSHCYLNQNAKVRAIARYPGVYQPLVELLLASDVGIFQMPCPEMGYLGAKRWGQVRDQYDTPMFRRHCESLSEPVLDQAEDYLSSGYRLLAFVMVDGSPVCGLKRTPQPAMEGERWGGMVWYLPKQRFIEGRGVFCEILQRDLTQRGLGEIPFLSLPETDEVGPMEEALQHLRQLLG